MGHGSQSGRQLVHNGGVRSEISDAVAVDAAMIANRVRSTRWIVKTSQHSRPIIIIERPIVLSTSTRSRSLSGAQPSAITNSCSRKSNAKPKISAPRRIVDRAISAGGRFFFHSFSVTSAKEMPARNKNNGAGKVPPSCEYMKNLLWRAWGLSQES